MNREKVIVTGASSGIGRATAQRFAAGGWDVCVLARREAELDHLLAELPAGDHLKLAGDYACPDTAARLETLLRERWGRLDALGNCAGVFMAADAIATPLAADIIRELARHPRIVGLKDSTRDLPGFLTLMQEIHAFRPDFIFFTGTEEILLSALLMGAAGGTIATAGCLPEAVLGLYQAWQRGEADTARRLQLDLLPAIKLMFSLDFPLGFRAAVELFGDTPAETLRKAQGVRANGFRAAKFGWGPFGVELAADEAHVRAVAHGRRRRRARTVHGPQPDRFRRGRLYPDRRRAHRRHHLRLRDRALCRNARGHLRQPYLHHAAGAQRLAAAVRRP
jgi:hypothetical protein